ncbi:hypothetical protein ACO1L0_14945, partial [Staphylococcus aureus]
GAILVLQQFAPECDTTLQGSGRSRVCRARGVQRHAGPLDTALHAKRERSMQYYARMLAADGDAEETYDFEGPETLMDL